MDKSRFLVVLLCLFIIVVDRSDGLKFRKLATSEAPNASSNANQDSHVPSPVPNGEKQNLTSGEETKPKETQITSKSDTDSKSSAKTSSKDPSDKDLKKGKSQDVNQKADSTSKSDTATSESCKEIPSCSDQGKTIIACIQNSENGSENMTLLVENEGDSMLKVDLTIVASKNYSKPTFEIPAHQIEKVNFTYSLEESATLILTTGNGVCRLHIDPPKTKNIDNSSKPDDKDSPSKPEGPSKSESINGPSKAKDKDNPSDKDGLSKPKDQNDPSKSKNQNVPSKPKDIDDPLKDSKSKDVDDPSKSKDQNGPSKDKDEPSKDPKSKDVGDPSKSKDSLKSKDVDEPSKPKAMDDPKDPKHDDTGPKPTFVNVPASQNDLLTQLSFYSKQVTPIYGAYFAFLVALVIGGTWAYCSFWKRRSDGGVPYQELEMGLPESSNVEPEESWDQDWDDDDWDEDKAIRSPGGGVRAKGISSNGLSSRTPKKDGWDADWDD